MKRKVEILPNLDQIQALGSETRLRLFHFFTEGELSEVEVAEKLGVPPKSLYYHIRILLKAGLIHQTGVRQHAKKPQALYRAVSDSVTLTPNWGDGKQREASIRNYKAILRIAAREIEWAMQDEETAELCSLTRKRLNLTPESARRFDEELAALIEKFSRVDGPGRTVCFTAVSATRPPAGTKLLTSRRKGES
ncbi:MAG: helix-turn-helix domain-containing protein [Armatimonadetes bacterium]|nr:helix-turn-helix domain-containing protein [Armatimonadota bacterium]